MLRGSGDLLGGHQREAGEALEAVELSCIGARFRNAVGEQDKAFSGCQAAMHQFVGLIRRRGRAAARGRVEFAPGKIRSDVAGVGKGEFAGERRSGRSKPW